jgi:hypothetical protein
MPAIPSPFAPAVPSAAERPPTKPSTTAGPFDDRPTTPAVTDGGPPTDESLPALTPERAHDDVEVSRLPGGFGPSLRGAAASAARLKESLAKSSRPLLVAPEEGWPRWLLPVLTGAAVVVGVTFVAIVASLAPKAPPPIEASAPPPAVAAAPPPAVTPRPAASPEPAPVAPAPLPPCTVAGTAQSIAPTAIVGAGIELRAVGDAIAVGYAPSEHEGVALRLDPTSLASSAAANVHSKAPVRRVTPLPAAGGALAAVVDTDRKGDSIRGRRTIAVEPQVQIGLGDGHVVWTKPGVAATHDLWAIDGDAEIDAIRGVSERTADEATLLVGFRRGNAVFLGLGSGGDWVPTGDLIRFGGLGQTIGAPAIALENGTVMVAWADRATAAEPWRLRWAHFRAGQTPGDPEIYTPPAGGKGEQAMSPSIAALPGDRFLLVWSEGPPSRHSVRAQTLSGQGLPLGPALEISTEGANAGQGQAAVTTSGKGVVAFLQSVEAGFELSATPIACGN